MMNDEEILAEIYRRSDARKRKLAARRKALAICVPMMAVVCTASVLAASGLWTGAPVDSLPGTTGGTPTPPVTVGKPGDSSLSIPNGSPDFLSPEANPSRAGGAVRYRYEGGVTEAGSYTVKILRIPYSGGGQAAVMSAAAKPAGIPVRIATTPSALAYLPQNAAAGYDEAFFAEKELLYFTLDENSGSIRHQVTGIVTDGTTLFIDVSRTVPETGTCDMASWLVLIEVEKTPIVAGCTGAQVRIHSR